MTAKRRLPAVLDPFVPPRHVIVATRQLATLVKAGIPLVQSLKLLILQSEHTGLKQVLTSVHRHVEEGVSFSEALRRYPKVFSDLYVNSIAAGEVAGVLDQILLRLAEVMEKDRRLIAEIKTALQMPIITAAALVIGVGVVTTFVVPRFSTLYKSFKTELPLPTQVLIGVSKFFTTFWWFYIPASVGLFFGVRRFIRTTPGRYLWDGQKLGMPIFGQLVQKMAMTRFATMFGILYSMGLPVLQALEVVSRAIGNAVVAREIEGLIRSVRGGKGLAGGLDQLRTFPPLVRHMIAVGEATGSLKTMLDNLATYYEEEVREAATNLTALIEPILTVAAGMAVLGLALAIFLPMWGLINVFKH